MGRATEPMTMLKNFSNAPLGSISTPHRYRPTGASQALCYARACYDHLAGNLAVHLRTVLERNLFIVAAGERDYEWFWCNFSREGRLSLFQLLPTRQALLPIPAGSWPLGW